MKQKILTALGWFLQVWAVLSLVAILYIVLFVPPPTEATPDDVKTKYEEIVSNMGPYDGLIWVGVFVLGRWMVKRNRKPPHSNGRANA